MDSLLHQSSGTQLPGVTKEEALLHLGLRAIEQVEDGQVRIMSISTVNWKSSSVQSMLLISPFSPKQKAIKMTVK